MNEIANIKTVQHAYTAFGQGNIPGILSTLAPQVEWTVAGENFIPRARTYRGPEDVNRFFQYLTSETVIAKFEPREFIAEGDRVIVLGHYAGQTKATGKSFAADWVMSFMFHHGKIVNFREYTDTAAIAASHHP